MNVRNAVTNGPNRYLDTLSQAWQAHIAPREPYAPTVVSTFAGCGGSSLGYSISGFRELLAVEWDENAVESFKLNFPNNVPVFHGDITGLSESEMFRLTGLAPGELDVLDGSPPCQNFSTAGRRRWGDPRSTLFREYVRLLRALQPKAFVMENVRGMVSGKMKLVFAEIMRELKASGYRVLARLMNAMYFGVPQNRQRLIFIGVRDDLRLPPSHPKAQSRPLTIAQAIGNLGNEQNPEIGHVWTDESPAGRHTKTWHLAHNAKQGAVYAGQQRRQRWHRPADTITTGGIEGMPPYLRSVHCHPLYTRTFSVLEYQRLSSFPDEFQFTGAWFEAVRRMGNSVPPLFMAAIAKHVRENMLCKVEVEN